MYLRECTLSLLNHSQPSPPPLLSSFFLADFALIFCPSADSDNATCAVGDGKLDFLLRAFSLRLLGTLPLAPRLVVALSGEPALKGIEYSAKLFEVGVRPDPDPDC